MRAPLLALAGLLLATPLAAQRTAPRVREVRVQDVRGTLTVTGWDRDSVALRGPAAGLALRRVPGAVHLERAAGGDASGDVELFVPRQARIAVRGGGSVDAAGLDGEMEVTAARGRIRVEGGLRRVSVEALEGNVEVVGPALSVVVRTAGGSVVVRGVRGELDVSTVSGAVAVGAARVTRARLASVSGEVSFKGVVEPGGTLEAASYSGDVELRLPPDLAATFELRAPVGKLTSEFGGGVRFVTGTGGAWIVAGTQKGALAVRRQPGADVDLNAGDAGGI
ncbi:MAG TPA: hypothetical protein VFX50_15225 [Gemmatimonadales bacterium]|nr:hypothetical protein [Gemmatimonadales bacterium]